jgi:hypothetical protein
MFDVRDFLREPLVHFLAIGAALFLVFGWTQERSASAPDRITVDAEQVRQLGAQFRRTWLRPPTEKELSGLIENHVRDEVYYREAIAMGLDQNDLMVRRRMRQKLEFILEDLTAAEPPGDDTLTDFLQANAERFRVAPRFSLQQIYLNPDRRQDLDADAEALIDDLRAGAQPETLGDQTLLPAVIPGTDHTEIARTFGGEFADKLVDLDSGVWIGPVYSGLGAHLVRVTERRDGRLPELAEVRGQVEREYLAQRRQELKEQAYRRLREGYEIVIEPPTVAADSPPAPSGG